MANTAHEALIAELLGDVGVLHDEVKALRDLLPQVADDVAGKMEVQTGNLLASADRLQVFIEELLKRVDDQAAASVKLASDAAKVDIRNTAASAAATAIRAEVGKEVREAVSEIKAAAAQVIKDSERARTTINAASKQVAWGWGKVSAVVAGASVFASILTIVAFLYMPAQSLSDEDATALKNGKTLQMVWDKWTPKERERFKALANDNKK